MTLASSDLAAMRNLLAIFTSGRVVSGVVSESRVVSGGVSESRVVSGVVSESPTIFSKSKFNSLVILVCVFTSPLSLDELESDIELLL
jgi:hypothetical protein